MARMADPGNGITDQEFMSNGGTVIVAGSDTTANLLAGFTYLLSQIKRCYDKLAHELGSRFKSEDKITLSVDNQLEYFTVCLTETLRRYHPTPAHLPIG